MKCIKSLLIIAVALTMAQASSADAAFVVRMEDRVYIEDRTGERWDVTTAQQAGFKPGKFEHGIGKHAFTPLDDHDFTPDPAASPQDRVIGVSVDGEAHAYAVERLSRHEIANTTIAGQPIAAGY